MRVIYLFLCEGDHGDANEEELYMTSDRGGMDFYV